MKILHIIVLASMILLGPGAGLRNGVPDPPREAEWFETQGDGSVHCLLCPRYCRISDGERGVCGVRENRGGTLYTLAHSNPCAVHIDPIEKKPLFHVLPGSRALSLAVAGCNLRCIFCQNWQISQSRPEETRNYFLPPQAVVDSAIARNCASIAYTYTEPTIFYEYMLDIAKLAKEKGIRNCWITCGYINPEPLRALCPYLDAANVDLKGFSDEFYRRIGNGSLGPVLNTLKILKEEGVFFEITNLIIPTLNDDMDEIRAMCRWIRDSLGPDYPMHFSRFHPNFKLTHVQATPIAVLERAREIALEEGMRYVYIGNVPGHAGEFTVCPDCEAMLVKRTGFYYTENLIEEGKCPTCGREILGIFE
jgi:pyruvate formate lyase activating enzyme